MNNTTNNESCGKSYFGSAVFVLPAVAFWLLAEIFILPKLHNAWMAINPTETGALNMTGLIFNILAPAITIVVVMLILEWRGVQLWSRYRRRTIGVMLWLFNFAVLVGLFSMIVCFGMLLSILR